MNVYFFSPKKFECLLIIIIIIKFHIHIQNKKKKINFGPGKKLTLRGYVGFINCVTN